MDTIRVAQAREEAAIGRENPRARMDSHAPATRRGASAFSKSTTALCLANVQVVADAALPNYESEIKHWGQGRA